MGCPPRPQQRPETIKVSQRARLGHVSKEFQEGTMSKPIDPRATWVLPPDELAARRKPADPDAPTIELRRLSVHEIEKRLQVADDDSPTALQPVLRSEDSASRTTGSRVLVELGRDAGELDQKGATSKPPVFRAGRLYQRGSSASRCRSLYVLARRRARHRTPPSVAEIDRGLPAGPAGTATRTCHRSGRRAAPGACSVGCRRAAAAAAASGRISLKTFSLGSAKVGTLPSTSPSRGGTRT